MRMVGSFDFQHWAFSKEFGSGYKYSALIISYVYEYSTSACSNVWMAVFCIPAPSTSQRGGR
jgi:hypothetical protein